MKKSIGKKIFDVFVLLGVIVMVFCIVYCFAMDAMYGHLADRMGIGELIRAAAAGEKGIAEEIANIQQTEPRKVFAKEEVVDVVYVGNSLLLVPDIPNKVESYAEKSGYTFVSHEYLLSGGSLQQSLDRAEMLEDMREALLVADIVVLQEYGSHYETTYEDICEFVKLCGEETEVYYYMTEFDFDYELLKKIAVDERVHLIPALNMTEIATGNMGYEYEEMTKPGDYHPSQTYAHICGLFTFSVISGQKCSDYPLADDDKILEYMKGETLEDKKACFEEMYYQADLLIGFYEENAKNWK
ncbi:MAG: hypothetical protein IJW63_06640 [Lachnospiraceae bacterium]|nr:hypothetical protein [Lachnospiraceae bacterium]